MLEAAQLVKVVLDEIGLRSFLKTSGGKGFHVIVPLTRRQGWSETKAFAHAVAKHMARVVPQRFSAVLGPKNRVGKIFIDYLRNSRWSQYRCRVFRAGPLGHGCLDACVMGRTAGGQPRR